MSEELRPVFIIGKHRSGTSWLGNLLAEHPKIYGVQNPDRHGIWESLYFTHIAEHFRSIDTTTEQGFEAWIDFMSRTNYVQFSPVSVNELPEIGPAGFDVLFRRFMNRAAQKKGVPMWIEKSPPHTLVASSLAEAFPDAKFIAMSRDFDNWLRSSVKHSERTGRLGSDNAICRMYLVAKLIGERLLYEAATDSLKEEYGDRVLHISYEDLCRRHDEIKEQVLSFLGTHAFGENVKSRYEPNSSFDSQEKKDRENVPSGIECRWARFVWTILRLIPPTGASLLTRLLLRIRDLRGRPVLDWFFRPEEIPAQ